MGRTERLSQPQQFGKYELVARLAHGRMGDVYKAKSHGVEGFEKILVVKVLNPALTQIPHFVDTVIEEAKRTVTLSHANVAQVYDLGVEQESGQYYIAQEYIGGFDLGRAVKLGRMVSHQVTMELALYVVSEIAKGLDYAHRRKDYNFNSLNLLHGDLAPRNVMLSFEGDVKLTDFGMSRALALVPVIDNEDTIQRMLFEAPEIMRGQPRNQKADIFAMGLLLYELLSGEHPYRRKDPEEVRELATQAHIAPIHTKADIPRPLAQIVDSMLVPDPAGRAANAGSLYEEMVAFIFGNNLRADARVLATLMQDLRREELRVAPDETTMEVGLEEISLTDLQLLAADDSEAASVTDSTNAEIPSHKIQKLMGQEQRPSLPGPLEEYFASVRGGAGKAVLVSGEFGAGRHYLPDRLPDALGWRGNTRAVAYQCCADDRYSPFGVLSDMLLELLDSATPEDAITALREQGIDDEVLLTLESIWGLKRSRIVGARIKRLHLIEVIEHILNQTTQSGPLVIVLDRIDRIDHVSIDVLRHVVAGIGERSVMLVMCTQIPEQLREMFNLGRPENLEAIRVVGRPGPNLDAIENLSATASNALAVLTLAGRVLSQADISQILGVSGEQAVQALKELTELGISRTPRTGQFMAGLPGLLNWVDQALSTSEIERFASAIARHYKHRTRPTDLARFGPAMTRWYALAADRRRMLRDAKQVSRWLESEGWLETVLDFYEYAAELVANHHLGSPQARIAFMLNRAELALQMAEIDVCQMALQPVNALSEMLRNDHGAIRGQLLRGQMAMQQDDLDDAFHHFRSALESARAISEPDLMAYGMLAMARWHDRYGDPVAGQSMLDGAMNLHRQFGTHRMSIDTRALMLNRAIRLFASRGLITRARRLMTDLRQLAQSSQMATVTCRADWAEASIHYATGDYAVARSFLAQAQQMATDHGLTAVGIELVRDDAAAALEAGHYDLVITIADSLIESGHRYRDFYSAQRGHDLRATAACMLNIDVDDALNHLATSLARARERNVPKDIYRCHVNLARALDAVARTVDAEEHRQHAELLAGRMRMKAA